MYLTPAGYFKNGWSVLNGTELYLYDTQNAVKFSSMFVVRGLQILGCLTDKPILFTSRNNKRELYKLEIILS